MTTPTLCVAIAVTTLTVAGAAQSQRVHAFAQDSTQRSFAGHTVNLDLSTGQYRVSGSPDNRIRVTPRTKADQVSVRINVNVSGTEATLRVVGPKEGFDADIQLPARVALVVELAGGSLQLSGVEGTTDVSAKDGNVEIAVGSRDRYRAVTASVKRGDVIASAFGEYAPGSGSFRWTGRGAHDLRVRVGTGRVTLKE